MNNPNVPLTHAEGTQLGEVYARWVELRNQSIKTPTSAAEIKGCAEFLGNTLVAHASEFIGCWMAVRNEYEPMLGLLSRVSQRIAGINKQQADARASAEAAQQAEPGKIITITDR